MPISNHQAPTSEQMRIACQQARQFWHDVHPNEPIHLNVDDVPQFVPGLGDSGETYRVGSLHLTNLRIFLAVYLDVVTGKVQMEQPLVDVPRQ